MRDPLTVPLSFAQQRLWLVNALDPDSPAYNVRTAYRLRGPLDPGALRASLAAIVQRHDVLRTTFALIDGEPMQIIAGASEAVLPTCDLSRWRGAERAAEADRRIRSVTDAPFDLAAGPLMRSLLLRLGSDDHVLVLAIHHIVFDGGSVTPFNRELSALYNARCGGPPAQLDELSIQYADFAVWQRDAAQDDASASDLAYWREALAGAPPRIELPPEAPSAGAPRPSGAIRSIVMSAQTAGRLAALGRRSGATFFMTMLAAFNALLYRYTGQDDLVVGSPIANRGRTELEPLIGFFANTLPLRTRLHGSMSFAELVRQTRETTLAAFEHGELPFERIVAELAGERSADATPLVNVMFFARTDPDVALEFAGVTLERYPLASRSAKFDLSFRYAAEPHGLVCSIQYPTNRFTAAAIDAVLDCFVRLAGALADAPGAPIAGLALLGPDELDRLLDANPPSASPARDRPLRVRFEAQAALAPAAVALVCDSQTLRYCELNARANQLARALQARGVERGQVVGFSAEPGIWAIVSMLAILKAGAAYLPLDPRNPLERSHYMCADAGVRIVLTNRTAAERFAGSVAPDCVLEVEALDLEALAPGDLPNSGDLDDVAYVMYTSGTAGRPKGVLVTQRAVTNLVTHCAAVAIVPADVVAQFANLAFDAATFEIWGALLNGARLEIPAREIVLVPDALAAWLRARSISVAFVTSALLRHISRQAPAAFAALRCLIAGGEVLDPTVVAAILTHGPPRRLLNAYGPTETTTFATTYEISAGGEAGVRIPIGRPLTNVQTYILDAGGNAVPIGMRGQLHIGGAGLARGYLNDPELTARKFIRHPFAANPAARLYATGDNARFLPDGNIEFLGRGDRQVKIRGFRIEIDEVEAALKALPAVLDAFVTIREDEPGEPRIVAYVVDGCRPARDLMHWRRGLAQRLPSYMLPDVAIAVEALPLTANGKVDTRALMELPAGRAAVSPADPPQTPAERSLAGIIGELLGLAAVGRQADFFALGGHSLLAVRALARIADCFGVDLSLRDFFAGPTVAELARRVTSAPHRAVHPVRAPLDPRIAELSDAQIDALLAEALRE